MQEYSSTHQEDSRASATEEQLRTSKSLQSKQAVASFPAVQAKLASNQNELSNNDLPNSHIPAPDQRKSGPFQVPSVAKTIIGKKQNGGLATGTTPFWGTLVGRNQQGLALPYEAIYNRTHIIANSLGGLGNSANWVPAFAHFNVNKMWPEVESKLWGVAFGKRMFSYNVGVNYEMHPFQPGMLMAECFLPTGFSFNIKEYKFNGGNTESTDINNWTLHNSTEVAGPKVNYAPYLEHPFDFRYIRAFNLDKEPPLNIKNSNNQQEKVGWYDQNRKAQSKEQLMKFSQDQNQGFLRDGIAGPAKGMDSMINNLAKTDFGKFTKENILSSLQSIDRSAGYIETMADELTETLYPIDGKKTIFTKKIGGAASDVCTQAKLAISCIGKEEMGKIMPQLIESIKKLQEMSALIKEILK